MITSDFHAYAITIAIGRNPSFDIRSQLPPAKTIEASLRVRGGSSGTVAAPQYFTGTPRYFPSTIRQYFFSTFSLPSRRAHPWYCRIMWKMWRYGKTRGSAACLKSRRAPWAAAAIVAAGLWSLPAWAAAVQAAYSFRSPFDPQQCDLATRAGEAAIQRNPASTKAHLLLAEACLCSGLDGNPFALQRAVGQLRRILARHPLNFFAQLDYADALRRQFPASMEAYSALVRARRTLNVTDVGAARSDLRQYIAENLDAIRDQRARNAEFLLRRESHAADGALPEEEALRTVGLLAEMGAHGRQRAERLIDMIAARREATDALRLMRIDLLMPQLQPDDAVELYSKAAADACAGTPDDSGTCSMVRQRLASIRKWVSNMPGACVPPGGSE
jgi:hypothetical protein